MICTRFSAFCSLLLFLPRSLHTKPLQDWTAKDTNRYQSKEREEVSFGLNSYIESIKQDFLRSLNLSQVPSPEKARSEPPQFMIDLYNRYATDKSSIPVSNIIRSFHAEDIQLSSSVGDSIQGHILLFNVSIPRHEDITRAELKIHVSLTERHPGHLLIYDVLSMEPSENLRERGSFLLSKHIKESMWVTADVTGAVKRWSKTEKEKNKLEVFLKLNTSVEPPHKIGNTVNNSYPPLLIVFSDDKCNRMRESKLELKEMIAHEQRNDMETIVTTKNILENGNKPLSENKTRSKRSIRTNYCQKSSLIVNFKDIGWDTWIIHPKSYDAFECKGECYYPLTDNLTPTKHAIVQMLMHHKDPQKTKKVCCVPTKLDPISLIYKDDAGVVTLRNNYEGMKVAQCGCR
ncbi:growth/differentiation factor 2 [Discoglossus pictus]